MKSLIVFLNVNRKSCFAFCSSNDDYLCHWTIQSSVPSSYTLTSAPRILKMGRRSHRFFPSAKPRMAKTRFSWSWYLMGYAHLVMVAKENAGLAGEELNIAEEIHQIKSCLYQAVNGIPNFPFKHIGRYLPFTETRIRFCIWLWFRNGLDGLSLPLVNHWSVQSLSTVSIFHLTYCFKFMNLLWTQIHLLTTPPVLFNSPVLKTMISTCLKESTEEFLELLLLKNPR